MKTWFSNRILDAFAKSIFLFGVFHIVVLNILAFREGHQVLNIFTILSLSSFMPGLGKGLVSFILSYCIALAVYFFVYLNWTKDAKQNNLK